MTKVLQVRVDDKLKAAADSVFESMGLDTSTAVRMFLTAAVETRSIPFEIKSRKGAVELLDGYGSYVCDYGHVHDYRKLSFEDEESAGPFNTLEDAMRSLNDE
ncbi:MAG: type II toxin-antitoxin system RelB/DinJ family antitoxin [Coriobacteriales bacterium]|jgi:addiction module RelB/DinJ family antitoxin|nr:type II toxin-antitoxin system RelB/DinJ family antitoxin [Coriobacteriales bacterium]